MMDDRIKGDLITILDSSIGALNEHDSMELRSISDHTIHNASIFQDKDSITIAVIVYALSKLIDRMSRMEPVVISSLEKARDCLKNSDLSGYEENVRLLMDTISDFDRKLNLYIQKVINEAEIKKGSRLYEHGISLAQTAGLLGISQWELMKYIGQTKIPDQFEDDVKVTERLEQARRAFGLG